MAELPEDIITIREATALLKVTRQTVARYIESGRLRAYRLSANPHGRVRLDRRDVLALLTPYTTPYDKAAARVDASPALAAHRDFIMADWPEGDEHWRWVATATEREIIDWAEAGKR